MVVGGIMCNIFVSAKERRILGVGGGGGAWCGHPRLHGGRGGKGDILFKKKTLILCEQCILNYSAK